MQMFTNTFAKWPPKPRTARAPAIFGAYPKSVFTLETYPTPDPAPGVVRPPGWSSGPVSPDKVTIPGRPDKTSDAPTTVPIVPPAATTPAAETYASLPPQYLAGLGTFVGDPTGFYKERGAEKQAQTDYYNMLNMWANKAGIPLTADDWANVWKTLNAYKAGYAVRNPTRAFTVSDAMNYLNRVLTTAPALPQTSYLRTGEI